jgi:MFS family permease
MKSTLAPVASLLTGVLFLIIGHGLQLTVVPLRAEAEGWTGYQIGAIGSAYYAGFVGGCFLAPFIIQRSGHIRAFTALVSLTAAILLAHTLWVAFVPWFVFRLVIGASLAGLYMIIESWLNDRATNRTRGLIMSAYIFLNFVAITIGQMTVTLYPPTEFTLFAMATMAIAFAAIPVAMTRSAEPAPVTIVRFRPRALYRASPVGIVGVTLIGVANGSFWSLAAVATVGAGLTAAEAAIFMSIATAGGALTQWPVGRLSDRVDRRTVLITLLCLAATSGLILAFVPLPREGLFFMALLYGMAAMPTYSIAAAHAYDHAAPGTFVEVAAGVLLANASGAIIGPILASALMEQTNSVKLFLFTALVQALLAGFVFLRLRQRPPPAEKTGFDRAATAPPGPTVPPPAPDETATIPPAGDAAR